MTNFDWLVAAIVLTCLVASSYAADGAKLSLAANDLAAMQGIISKIPGGARKALSSEIFAFAFLKIGHRMVQSGDARMHRAYTGELDRCQVQKENLLLTLKKKKKKIRSLFYSRVQIRFRGVDQSLHNARQRKHHLPFVAIH
jgi:hypothetical protein